MTPLEDEILRRVRHVISEHGLGIADAGLVCSEPALNVQSSGRTRTSEVVVEVYRDGRLDDVLEFFVFREGEAEVTTDEAVEWVERQLAQMK